MKLKAIILLLVLCLVKTQAQNSLHQLASKSDFDKFSGMPLSNKYGQVTSIKVVYDLHAEKLYFINSKYFKYHHEFCVDLRGQEIDLELFNDLNYANHAKRDYLLGNINYYKSLNTYAIEISPVDGMPLKQIFQLYDLVSNASFLKHDLRFLLNSARLQHSRDTLGKRIPLIDPSDIYLNLTYQAISKYKKIGVLKFIKDIDREKNNLDPNDIIVIDKTPSFLPTVAGIIVTEFQTPLSHLTILGLNRKIPICAYKSAFDDTSVLKFNHKKVLFTVKSDSFSIEPAVDINNFHDKRKTINLQADLSVDTLTDIKYLDKKAFRYAGNKASNFGMLYKLSRKASFKVPEAAFAIPFYFYQQHIEKTTVKKLLIKVLSDTSIRANKDSLQSYLKLIRDEIVSSPIDSTLLNAVCTKIKSLRDFTSLRFRSSTNAEDAKGFSGAGLYSSETGKLNSSKKPIDKAIKEVWASLWSYEAFSEREYYAMQQENVYMGILVHRSFPSENVNGVAITKNLYRNESYGFVINAQLGDERVVKPKNGNSCDQFICYPNNVNNLYENKNAVDIISFSNLNNGKLMMTDAEIQNLANQLEIIKNYFYDQSFTSKSYLDFGLDVEFKLDGENRDLYIKQIRYYND